jgi:hypothetical protein
MYLTEIGQDVAQCINLKRIPSNSTGGFPRKEETVVSQLLRTDSI